MTTRPYELLARFDNQGNVAGVSVKSISTINGKDYELDPVPLKDATDPAFVSFASSFSASVVIERDVLATDKTKLTTDLAAMTSSRDALTTLPAELKANHAQIILAKDAEIAALQAAFNPPLPTPIAGATKTVSITVDATAWAGILASVYDPAIDVPAETQATDFILQQFSERFVAWAERENAKPIEAQAEAAKQQVKAVVAARAVEVLASTKVKIT